MASRLSLLALSLLLPLLTATAALAAGPGDIAVFWGRNKDEGTLSEACDTGTYNTVIISFLTGFGRGKYRLDLSGHPLAGVGDDIKHCRSKGILVLLSIGGPNGTYSLPSAQAAADLADYLWAAFLGGASRPGVRRPFGDAAVDGVDFFIDPQGAASTDHYDELARRLAGYNYKGKTPTLTATVRCRYPNPHMTAALATGLFFRVHVRLYGDLKCTWADREAFEAWAAAYPASKMVVGVVASPEADRDAYMFQKDLYYNVLQFAQKLPNYGGLMIWNRYYDKKTHYISSS